MLQVSQQSTLQKSFVLVGLVFGGIILSVLLSGLLLPNLYGISMQTLLANLQANTFEISPNPSRLFAGIQQFFTFLVPGIFFFFFYRQKLYKYSYSENLIFYVVALYVVAMPLVEFSYYINQFIPVNAFAKESALSQALLQQMTLQEGTMAKLGNILVLCVLPAIGEELVFRFGIQNKILGDTKLGTAGAIIVTSLIFSFIHFELEAFLPRFVLSIILGLAYVYSRTILVPITFHLLNNYLAFTQISANVEQNYFQNMFYNSSFLSVVVVVLCSFLCYHILKRMSKSVSARL